MTTSSTEGKKKIRLYSNSLLSKWGFNDGDILEDLTFDNNLDINEHKLLYVLVKKYLLPKLNHKVEVLFMETTHNPVRAKMIGGKDYSNWYDDDEWGDKLLPEFVEVSESEILELANNINEK